MKTNAKSQKLNQVEGNAISSQRTSEAGFFLPMFALTVGILTIILALVVDHSRESVSLQSIQRAVDLAALSGARQLNSTRVGFERAKKATLATLKENTILGAQQSSVDKLVLNEGPSNFWDSSSMKNTGTKGSAGGLDVSVERGVMWFNPRLNDGKGGYEFKSLEEAEEGKHLSSVDTYLSANAVRVRTNLDALETTFGKYAGVEKFENLEKSALALSDDGLELPVAPLAIPFCQLLMDTNVHVADGKHVTSEFIGSEQRKRELVFTEANPMNALHSPSSKGSGWNATHQGLRREGLTRFESHLRPPYVAFNYDESGGLCFGASPDGKPIKGEFLSCKHLPLYGTLGVPSRVPGEVASPEALAKAFQDAKESRLTAGLGMYFSPLLNLLGVDEVASEHVAQYIASAPTSFRDHFVDPSKSTQAQWYARDNFPFTRTKRPPKHGAHDPEGRPPFEDLSVCTSVMNGGIQCDPRSGICTRGNPTEVCEDDPFYDLRKAWPTRFVSNSGIAVFQKLLMDRQAWAKPIAGAPNPTTRWPGEFTNPLCHDSRLPIDDLDNVRVREALAMVVAPGVEKLANGEEVVYCDFENVFASKTQRAIPPVAESQPTVVGFMRVLLYDFNFTNLDRKFAPTPEQIQWLDRNTENDTPKATPEFGVRGTPSYVMDRNPGEWEVSDEPTIQAITKRQNDYKQTFKDCVGAWDEYEVKQAEYQKKLDEVLADEDPENDDSLKEPKEPDCEREIPDLLGRDLLPESIFRCFNFVEVFRRLEESTRGWSDFKTCFSPLGVNKYCMKRFVQGDVDKLFKLLEEHFKENIPSNPNAHCLPLLRPGKFDLNDPRSFEELRPLDAGWGCGGIRARFPDYGDSSVVWSSGKRWEQASPVLAEADSK